MATKTDILRIRLEQTGDGQVKASLAGVESGIRRVGKESDQARESALSLGTALQAIASAAVVRGVVSSIIEFEKLRAQLDVVEGSTQAGAAAFEKLQAIAQKAPFQLAQITRGYVTLKNFGLDPLNGTYQAVIEQASALGASQENLIGISTQLGQAWAANKLQGQDILALINNGVPVWGLLSSALHKTTAELRDMSQKGLLGRDAIRALIAAMGKTNAGAAAKQMETLGGKISNLQDAASRFAAALGDAGLSSALKGVTGLLTVAANHQEAMLSGTLGLAVAMGSRLVPALYRALQAGTAVSLVMKTLGGPVGIILGVASALTVLVAANHRARVSSDELKASVDGLAESYKKLSGAELDGAIVKQKKFVAALREEQAVAEARLETLNHQARFAKNLEEQDNKTKLARADAAAASRKLADAEKLLGDMEGRLANLRAGRPSEKGDSNAKDKAAVKAVNQIQTLIKSLEDEAATYGMTSEQIAIYRLRLLGATDAQIRAAEAAANTIALRRQEAQMIRQHDQDMLDAEQRAIDAENQRTDALKSRLSQLQRELQTEMDAEKQHYKESLQLLQDAEQSKLITAKQYADLRAKLEEDHVKRVEDINKKGIEQQTTFAEQAARNIQNSLGGATLDIIKGDWKSLGDTIIGVIQQIAAQMAASELSRILLGGYGTNGSNQVGGILGSVFNAFVHHGGGMAGTGAQREVPAGLFAGAPRFHGGSGILGPGEIPTILQTGEKVLSRDQVAQGTGNTYVFAPVVNTDTGAEEARIMGVLRKNYREFTQQMDATRLRYNLAPGK